MEYQDDHSRLAAAAGCHRTADHIAKGRRRRHCDCPIALAICEQLGLEPSDDLVYITSIKAQFCFRAPDKSLVAIRERVLPVEVQRFIRSFDSKHLVAPFTFVL